MTVDPALDPEGLALVHRIHTRKLLTDLERQENHWARLVSQAAALGTLPQAGPVWELAHQAAAATAATRSRLTQHRWNE